MPSTPQRLPRFISKLFPHCFNGVVTVLDSFLKSPERTLILAEAERHDHIAALNSKYCHPYRRPSFFRISLP